MPNDTLYLFHLMITLYYYQQILITILGFLFDWEPSHAPTISNDMWNHLLLLLLITIISVWSHCAY